MIWKTIPHYPQYIAPRTVNLLDTLEAVLPLSVDPGWPKDVALMGWLRDAADMGLITGRELSQARMDIGPNI